MKKLFYYSSLLFSPLLKKLIPIFLMLFTTLQINGQFEKTISNNYTIIVLGRDQVPLYEAKVTARGKELLTNHEGQVEYKQPQNVVSVSASGYLTKNVDLRKYPQGSLVSVQLTKLADITKVLDVHVKDTKGKAVAGALVLVQPGVSGVTDGSGYAKAEHKQQPGEYIEVIVSANGYKDQQKRVLVGMGQGNAITQPTDVVRFTLESTSSATLPLIVEVYDGSNFKPLGNVYVEAKVTPSGATAKVFTDQIGEARFTVNAGDQIKIIARLKGYKEKWSDIPVELLQPRLDERRFTVYLELEACKLEGIWTQDTPGVGSTDWEIKSDGTATETGIGYAKGIAKLSKDNVLHIDWQTKTGYSGYYEWTLDQNCKSTKGKLVFKTGRTDSLNSTVKRK